MAQQYNVPSSMHVFDDGEMITDIDDEETTSGEPIATVIMHIDQNGKPVRGIEGPNGFVYELPSFMKVPILGVRMHKSPQSLEIQLTGAYSASRGRFNIDTCFDRLVRLTTAKADKTADAVISKSEALEEQVLKALSGQAVRNKLETVEQRLNANAANVAELKRMLQGIHRTLGRLGNEVAQYACKGE